jgi:hypothetical protein
MADRGLSDRAGEEPGPRHHIFINPGGFRFAEWIVAD